MTKQKAPFYVINVFGQDRAVIINSAIRKATSKETCSIKDLENLSKAFSIEFTQVPKPSSFPSVVGVS